MLLMQVIEADTAETKNVSFGSYPWIWIKREKDALAVFEIGKVITLQLNVLILVQCGLSNNLILLYSISVKKQEGGNVALKTFF